MWDTLGTIITKISKYLYNITNILIYNFGKDGWMDSNWNIISCYAKYTNITFCEKWMSVLMDWWVDK